MMKGRRKIKKKNKNEVTPCYGHEGLFGAGVGLFTRSGSGAHPLIRRPGEKALEIIAPAVF
jgi:hypothetical protein